MIKIEELIIKKCEKCGNTVRVLNNTNTITCCGEDMKVLEPLYEENNVHVPNAIKKDRSLYITMDHVMEEDHYISKIYILRYNEVIEYNFTPEDEIAFAFPYSEEMKVYALCNKHGLWEGKIK